MLPYREIAGSWYNMAILQQLEADGDDEHRGYPAILISRSQIMRMDEIKA